MPLSEWFSFRSKEQKEKDAADYYTRMFPLGEEQKQQVEKLISELIGEQTSEQEKMYLYLTCRQALGESDQSLALWYSQQLLKKYSEESRQRFIALARCQQRAASREELPDQETVLKDTEEVREKVVPQLKNLNKSFIQKLLSR